MRINRIVMLLIIILLLSACTTDTEDSLNMYDKSKEDEEMKLSPDNQSENNDNWVKLDDGFEVIDNYTLAYHQMDDGDFRIIIGYFMVDDLPLINIYIIDENENIIFDIGRFETENSIYSNMINMSLNDINEDGFDDLIVIGEFMKGQGVTAGQLYPIINVYLQNEYGFSSFEEFNTRINTNKEIYTVEDVVDFYDKSFSQ